jgi:Ca2+-binding EF-hand superfamily protein
LEQNQTTTSQPNRADNNLTPTAPTAPSEPVITNNPEPANNEWDISNYLKQIFNDIDKNNDGSISSIELHEALRRGSSTSQFDQRTIEILLKKYDENNDGEISFTEFHALFMAINDYFNEFLDIDNDSSSTIDSNELAMALRQRDYLNISHHVLDFIINSISSKHGSNGITFDLFVRVLARFDTIKDDYDRFMIETQKSGDNRDAYTFDSFVKNYFFYNF